ncbi:reticulon-4-interacting protein 1 homolog, mitochondrial-like isoform X2 [Gambusia affinis]|uniref:reticulon-4-interacting protein 1 homolog, mitochondrial-like isoform X2 n=1 Tax=Gambusia affinis TaxID=33528 RepID=UPI001CDD6538|nr:reticulon-4-interacting protein 1 homolog, mitochondrial-like isoform X2 [Gambusia affinis]
MASVRLLCLFNGRAAGWSKTLARTGWRNVCSSPSRLQSMSAWVIDQYGSSGVLRHTEEIPIPTVNFAHDVMINVRAASLNPLDLNMRGGYGATLLNLRRDPLSVVNSFSEFPLILGRDLSGVVVDCGSGVTHFAPGDEVWAAIPPWKQGSLAEYVTLTEYEVSYKPKSLSHIEAASIPYVANTALSALVNAGGLCRENSLNKRVLITGASGGVGTFSIQNAEGLVRGLGADEVVDYTAGDVADQLDMMERFDVILDNVGGDTEEWAMRLLKPWSGAKFVTLVSPLILNTDSMGLLDGSLHTGLTLHNKAFQNITSSGVFYRWAFYAPDGPTLDEVSRLVDAGKILPVVEAQFPFSQVPQAFQKLEQGHARGKTVVEVAKDDEYMEATESEQKVQETLQQN